MAKQKKSQAAATGDPVLNERDLAARYGWALSVLNSDPSLKRLFKQAVAETWEPGRFVAELRKTKWFQTHSEAARNATVLRTTDPKTWAAKVNQAGAVVKDMAVKMGAQLSDETLRRIVNNVLTFGWNDAQIQDTLAGSIKMGAQDTYGGQAAVNAETLRALAMNNGVKIGDGQLRQWLVRLGAGEDIAGFEQYVRKIAAGAFPGFEQELNSGMNVRDLADPYVQQMAQTLELSPDSLDLFDPTIRKALQSVDPASGKLVAKPIWEFERELKQDPRWLQTNNARDTLDHTTRSILSQWGLVS